MAEKVVSGDEVVVISGKNKGQRGRVRTNLIKRDRVVIEGVNIVRRHLKRGRARQAGIVEMEAPLHVSNVMVWCPNHNGPARVGFRSDAEGNKERYCKQCDAALPKPRPAEKKRS
ncbi:MAG TPA: 50S ribosomal protein L24 [Thermomicrobiales bacterium]|nr:50S ribosomal protein L24 [Thermomicrobiales bacterium]